MISLRRTTTSLLLAAALLVGAPTAWAEPSADDRAMARTLFEDGRNLAKQSNFKDAIPKLEESQRLDPGIGTLFNLADAYEKVGRFASAWAAFAEVGDLAKRAGQTDRETIARDRSKALAPKLTRLRVHITTPLPPGLELRFDEKPFSTALLDTDAPVDSGEHRMRASAPGKVAAETKVTVQVGVPSTTVELPALVDAPPDAPPIAAAPPPVQTIEPPSARGEPERTWQKPTSYVVGGLGIAGLAVGTIFGLRASSQWSDAEGTCPQNRCDADGYGKWEDARSSATISTIAFVAGAVLTAAGAVLFYTAPSSSWSTGKLAPRPWMPTRTRTLGAPGPIFPGTAALR